MDENPTKMSNSSLPPSEAYVRVHSVKNRSLLTKAIHLCIGAGMATALLFTLYSLQAWTGPTATAPGSNTAAPVNVGATGQTKSGGLLLNSGGATNGLIVQSGNVGIGTTDPGRKIDIEQSGTDYQMRIGDGGANYYDIGRNTSNGLLTFYANQAAASGYVFGTINGGVVKINTNGWLGIRVNPIRQLTVENEQSFVPTGSAGYINVSDGVGSNGGNYSLYLRGLGSSGTVATNLAAIYLQANTTQLGGSLQFPDGTTQTTAAGGGAKGFSSCWTESAGGGQSPSMQCSSGTMVSGGCSINGATANANYMRTSAPSSNGWVCSSQVGNTSNTVYVRCCS